MSFNPLLVDEVFSYKPLSLGTGPFRDNNNFKCTLDNFPKQRILNTSIPNVDFEEIIRIFSGLT